MSKTGGQHHAPKTYTPDQVHQDTAFVHNEYKIITAENTNALQQQIDPLAKSGFDLAKITQSQDKKWVVVMMKPVTRSFWSVIATGEEVHPSQIVEAEDETTPKGATAHGN